MKNPFGTVLRPELLSTVDMHPTSGIRKLPGCHLVRTVLSIYPFRLPGMQLITVGPNREGCCGHFRHRVTNDSYSTKR